MNFDNHLHKHKGFYGSILFILFLMFSIYSIILTTSIKLAYQNCAIKYKYVADIKEPVITYQYCSENKEVINNE